MPSPVGHSCIGIALALARLLPRGSRWKEMGTRIKKYWVPIVCFVCVANVADVDYIPGVLTGRINEFHHFYTHTLFWAVLVAVGAWLCWKAVKCSVGWREFFFLLMLTVSHLVADVFTSDGSIPYGIMAWWPVSDRYIIAAHPIFMKLHKATWSDVFQFHNVKALVREAALTLPLVCCVLLFKHRRAPSG